jgi:hypothetical protein
MVCKLINVLCSLNGKKKARINRAFYGRDLLPSHLVCADHILDQPLL